MHKLKWMVIFFFCLALLINFKLGPPPAPASEYVKMDGAHPFAITPNKPQSMDELHQGVVRIQATDCERIGWNILGTGFAIAPHWILTNKHVINNTQNIRVFTNEGKLITQTETPETWATRQGDLALIYLPDETDVIHFEGRDQSAADGEEIFFIGYPGGKKFSIHHGQIVSDGGPDWGSLYSSYRVSAKLLAGNSGGPLLDSAGRVLGVGYARSGDVAYAYPLAGVESLLQKDNLIRPKSCPYLKPWRKPNPLEAIYGPFYHPVYGPPLPKGFHLPKE